MKGERRTILKDLFDLLSSYTRVLRRRTAVLPIFLAFTRPVDASTHHCVIGFFHDERASVLLSGPVAAAFSRLLRAYGYPLPALV